MQINLLMALVPANVGAEMSWAKAATKMSAL